MGNMNKSATTYIIRPYPGPQPCDAPQDWETHPSWIAGIAALNAYNEWVAQVVMPIVFQWIEEHKSEVYAHIPEHLKDDVGVVTAAAFELVKHLGAYQKGLVKYEEYERAVKDGTWDTTNINPVWTSIAKDVREATDEIFDAHKDVLKDTIR
jgi:hypothetical protein